MFGLEVYCVSLNDKDLTESDLCSLFDSLPDRCIVLLEDIDSAGLKREEESVVAQVTEDGKPDVGTGQDVIKQTAKTESSSGSISLSALLNVIDGAASHEVRIADRFLLPALIVPSGSCPYHDDQYSRATRRCLD
jgi:chaperone BCS1